MLLWQKVIEMRRRNRAIKRGGKHSVIQGSALVDGDGNDRFELLAESDEDPMRSVEMTDLMETLMSHIHDKKALEIIALKREGTTNNEEIAARLGIGVASVYRKLNLVKDIWKPILDAL